MTDIATSPGGALIPDSRYGTGAINSVSLVTPAWFFNVLPLWFDDPDVKGKTRDIPGVEGGVPLPRRAAPTEYSLKGVISGFVDSAGNPYDDPWDGLEANRDYLAANVTGPRSIGDGTYPAVIVKPSGRMLTGDITPEGMKSADGGVGPIVAVVYKLQVASGGLAGRQLTTARSSLTLAGAAGAVLHP